MALPLFRDFVKETTTVTGTGPATLLGAVSPGQRFSDALSNGDTCDYAIAHETANEWEVGTGVYSANVLTRTTVTASSNGGAAVSFSAGTKRVELVDSALRAGRRVGPVVIGATSLGIGSLSFSDAGGVSWGLSTDSDGGTITATVGGGGGVGLLSHVAGQSVTGATRLAVQNSNGIAWTLSTAAGAGTFRAALAGTTTLTNLGTGLTFFTDSSIAAGSALGLQGITNTSLFSEQNVSFAARGNDLVGAAAFDFFGAGTDGIATRFRAQNFSVRNTNGVSWSMRDSTFAGFGRIVRLEASVAPQIGVISHVGGNVVSNVTQFAVEDASNVTWSLSTAAGAATLFGSVAAGGGGGISAVNLSAGTTSIDTTRIQFPNLNGNSWGITGGSAISLRAAIAFSAGTLFQFQQNMGFADQPGLSWSYAGSQISGVPLNSGLHVVSDNATSNNFSRLAFGSGNGLTLGISTGASAATVTGSYTVPTVVNSGLLAITNAASSVAASRLALSNANGFSFLLSTGGSVGTLSGSYSTLSFSNANNVTFGIAGSTITATASFAAGAGVTHAGFLPNWGAAVVVTQSLSNATFWVQPLGNSPAFSFDRMVQLFGLSNATNATNSNTLRLYAGLYSRNGSTLSLISSSSSSAVFTGSGTVGNYSLFSGPRNMSVGWSGSIAEGDYWIGVGASLSTAGNNSFSISYGMLSQSITNVIYGLGAASNATFQSALGKGFFSATTSAPPSSIAFSQIQGTNSVAYRFPALYFGSGTA